MAIIDDKRDACVVRIVYDGPPFSGKTTTLRALSQHLSRPMESPEEHDGRTLYFDWLDYTAGRFEGRPIRCQIVSVPGQRSLVARRKALLREADSIVFVADTGSIGMELSLKYARELGGILSGLEEPRPGVIIGANKRDVDDAMQVADIVEQFHNVGLDGALIETTAISGSGVHEAFLFGVRLALDRVRELSRRGLLATGSPVIDSCGDLLKELTDDNANPNAKALTPPAAVRATEIKIDDPPNSTQANDQIEPVMVVEKATPAKKPEPRVEEIRPADSEFPDPSVPSGFIWPPIEGRVILQQAVVTSKPVLKRSSSGNLYALSTGGWAIHSRKQDLFADQKIARAALVEWARLHVRNKEIISGRRCIVLSADKGSWRLWQIVRINRSIDVFLSAAVRDMASRESIEHLLVASRKLLQAARAFPTATVRLSVDPDRINADSADPEYVGFMPGFDQETSGCTKPDIDESAVIAGGLGQHIRSLGVHVDASQIVSEFDTIRTSTPGNQQIANILQELVMASEAIV